MGVSTQPKEYDAVVIGSGAGGVSAAARLAHHGYTTLLVESRDRIGGRASTIEKNGFMLNTGAVALEFGGTLQETCEFVGAPYDVRKLDPPTVYRVRRHDMSLGGGGWVRLIESVTKKGGGLIGGLKDARNGALPDLSVSTKDWLNQYTRNKTIHALFRNLCGAIFSVNSDELPASAFLGYFMQKSAFKNFGFSPTGTIGVMQGLADTVVRNGGDVWLNSPVVQLNVKDGAVRSATIEHDGKEMIVEADVFISNAGPAATVQMAGRENFDDEYLTLIDKRLTPTAIFAVHIASTKPLSKYPGIIAFGLTQRLCNLCNLTATCPELAPPGQYLAVAYSVPKPAIGDFDEKTEIALTIQDLRDQYKNFDDYARVLEVEVRRGDWPGQRSGHGYELPRETPLPNLWNVGDAVREFPNGGTEGCSETGKLVVEQVLASHAPRQTASAR
ncbi:phytoene desaturase family protein [Mycobacterium paraintracellulare]|uniref:phytoene desaturase family protein n=1 Tax=Mycobacterium paraintracellulare TaxID=1138383 RepID=UPI001926A4A7|nr:FAD-dependent oxidoreductase [Mycobacterium paraintracellulare]BCP14190.1 oxidoreductase [Mycobacterium paraintracellulare]